MIRVPRASVLALALAAPIAGCASHRVPPDVERVNTDSTYFAPDWNGDALSWTKLEKIEDWLIGPGPNHFPQRVPGAELELAEGRLELARRESATLPARTLEMRLASAQAGFRRVKADPRSSAIERSRADAGLASLQGVKPEAAPSGAVAGVLPRSSWGAAPPNAARMTRSSKGWKRITIHHSAIASAGLGRSLPQVADAIRRIQTDHMRDRRWGDIGYHFLIDPTGRVFQGRSLEWQGAHAEGSNNVANIGICLLGDFDHERPDPRALRALEELVGSLRKQNSIPVTAIKGHEQFKPTDCPGHYLMDWVRRYASSGTAVSAAAPRESRTESNRIR